MKKEELKKVIKEIIINEISAEDYPKEKARKIIADIEDLVAELKKTL